MDKKAEQVLLQLENDYSSIDNLFPDDVPTLRYKVLAYFKHLEYVSSILQRMVEKELRLEPFNKEEEAFIKDTTVLQKFIVGCGDILEEWSGWYPQ